MNKKYQEALDDVFSEHPMSKERNLECKKLLQELVDKEKSMRTEKEVLKDFEKLGYYLNLKKEGFLYNGIILSNKNIKELEIHISFSMKSYAKYEQGLCRTIDMQEHKLLTKLFQIWNWL